MPKFPWTLAESDAILDSLIGKISGRESLVLVLTADEVRWLNLSLVKRRKQIREIRQTLGSARFGEHA